MKKLGNTLAIAAIAVGAMIGVASAAHADVVIPGTGYAGLAGNGNSGFDAWGQKWNWGSTTGVDGQTAGLAAWGTPGLGLGTVTSYQGSAPATDFEVSFVNPIIDINQLASTGAGGYNESTRFDVCAPNCVEWTPVFVGSHEVDFFAPTGTSLKDGDDYFVNVIFDESSTKVNGFTSGFSAVFTRAEVPEPATWAMMLVGFGGLGALLRSRRSTVALTA